ncbi:hypothetical protein BaRGS_00023026 [Batillaria attramentaria]|uniref:Uncharacterized protein n=1 Tax=Batillaria attramentaria TaxID=370345 RepID=A0ABD0KFG6_9CAEN
MQASHFNGFSAAQRRCRGVDVRELRLIHICLLVESGQQLRYQGFRLPQLTRNFLFFVLWSSMLPKDVAEKVRDVLQDSAEGHTPSLLQLQTLSATFLCCCGDHFSECSLECFLKPVVDREFTARFL